MKRLQLLIALVPALLCGNKVFAAVDKVDFSDFKPDPAEWRNVTGTHLSWGTTDFSFYCYGVPQIDENKDLLLKGWRGENVYAKAVIWTAEQRDSVYYKMSNLVGADGSVIKASDCEIGFMRNVISDKDDVIRNGCNKGKPEVGFKCDVTLVPDMIDPKYKKVDMHAMHTQCIWITCPIPSNDYVGDYKGSLKVYSKGEELGTLNLTVRSLQHILPPPSDWKHYTAFWVHYYPVADYYKVPYWSKAHFKWLKLVYKRLYAAGQKSCRPSVCGPTDKKMVKWTLNEDGDWEFDYTVFDKFVEFSTECGMTGDIECAGLSHRKGNVFQYWDAADGKSKKLTPGFEDSEYRKILVTFIKDFSKHLKEKGWFERAMVSTDELGHDQNDFFIKSIRKGDPKIRIMTSSNHADVELEEVFDNLSYASHCKFDLDILKERQAQGKPSTQYICCSETHPNRYVFSDPYECTYISYNTFVKGLDGFLCWAVCWWSPWEMKDTRRAMFYSGEYAMFYPYDKTSQRWEKFIEGVQDYEKLHILTEEYKKAGNKAALDELDMALLPLKAMAWNDTRKDVFDREAVPAAIAAVKELLNR